jgi:hypothetical protein
VSRGRDISVWTPERDAQIRAMYYDDGKDLPQIAAETGITLGSLRGRSMRLNLHRSADGQMYELKTNDRAVIQGRTMYPTTVKQPRAGVDVLKSGRDNAKLGSVVTKGRWKGMPIYSLTLEERATCSRECPVYRGCFGNGMQWAARYAHGPALEAKLDEELRRHARGHPQGFVIRLHALGDFYSVGYVFRWARWLEEIPQLRVFGYTAWAPSTLIGAAVAAVRDGRWDRFSVRTSSATHGPTRTVVVRQVPTAPISGAIVCPAQTGKTQSCAQCALCWSHAAKDRTILFIGHGNKRRGRKPKTISAPSG